MCVGVVVGKEDVRHLVVVDESHDVPEEIAVVHNVDFLERMEQVTRYGIAETVFQEQQAPSVFGRSDNLCRVGVSADESGVGCRTSVREEPEEVAFLWSSFRHRFALAVSGVIYVCRCVFHVAWHVVHKILRCSLDRCVTRKLVHRTHEIANHHTVVVVEFANGTPAT